MSETVFQVAKGRNRALDFALEAAVVVCASLFVAVCARIYLPIPGTPVPLTPQNFAVLVVGLALGSGGYLPAWLAAWMPNLSFGLIGFVLMTRLR